jgi:hypothetical protein
MLQPNPIIQEMVNSVSSDSILANIQRLQAFVTRYSTHDSCFAAAEWIFMKLSDYGLDSVYYDSFPSTIPKPPNVVGIKDGSMYPDSCYTLILGHFDSMNPLNHDSAPGADDNASGVAAVLEAARVMQDYTFESNVRFLATSDEEILASGAWHYASTAQQNGDDILASYNFDMIGYVDDEPESLEICGMPADTLLMQHFSETAQTYTTLLTRMRLGIGIGDDQEFRACGYRILGLIEDIQPVMNPYTHTAADTIGTGFNDISFCTEVIRAGIATLASYSIPVGIAEDDNSIVPWTNVITVFPNPFSNTVEITLNSKEKSDKGHLVIHDVSGRQVRNLTGTHGSMSVRIPWNGVDDFGNKLPSGVYYIVFKAEGYRAVQKLMLIQ